MCTSEGCGSLSQGEHAPLLSYQGMSTWRRSGPPVLADTIGRVRNLVFLDMDVGRLALGQNTSEDRGVTF